MKTYTLSHNYFMIHDRARSVNALDHLFQDSHAMFKLRVQHLGNPKTVTTEEDSETLRVMLEALISAKKHIQSVS
jgi:hypothetical protein